MGQKNTGAKQSEKYRYLYHLKRLISLRARVRVPFMSMRRPRFGLGDGVTGAARCPRDRGGAKHTDTNP
jgi:hypothetical protein